MSRPDEGMIHAWLDGELTVEEAARVAKLAVEDPEWGAALAEARGLVAASSRIVSALDVVPAGVMPAGSRAAGAPAFGAKGGGSRSTTAAKPRFTMRPWMRMAAGFVLVVGTATAVWTRTAETPQLTDARLVPTEQAVVDAAAEKVSGDEARSRVAATAGSVGRDAPREEKAITGRQDASANAVASNAAASSATGGTAAAAPAPPPATTDALGRRANEAAQATVAEGLAQGSLGAAKRAEAERAVPPEARAAVAAKATAATEAVTSAQAARAAAPAASFRAARETDAGVAADAMGNALQLLTGCWKAAVAGRADSVLVDPRIARQAGDTLVLVVAADGRTATVRHEASDTLRGETRFGQTAAVAFVGTRMACPRAP